MRHGGQDDEDFADRRLVVRAVAEIGGNRIGDLLLVLLDETPQPLEPVQPHGLGGEALGGERVPLQRKERLQIER